MKKYLSLAPLNTVCSFKPGEEYEEYGYRIYEGLDSKCCNRKPWFWAAQIFYSIYTHQKDLTRVTYKTFDK